MIRQLDDPAPVAVRKSRLTWATAIHSELTNASKLALLVKKVPGYILFTLEKRDQQLEAAPTTSEMPAQVDRTYHIQSKAQDLARRSALLSLDDLNGRRELLNAAYALCHELESPMEAIFRTVVVQVCSTDKISNQS